MRGLLQGTLRQIFDLLGWALGIGSCLMVSQWVGAYWQDARPALVFAVLGWLVAVLAGLAVKALFQWWGERLAEGASKSGAAFLDRLGGVALGALIGAVLVSALVVGLLLAPWPRVAARTAARAQVAGLVLGAARTVLDINDRWIPGGRVLKGAVEAAARRADELSRRS